MAVQLLHDLEAPNGHPSIGIFELRACPRLVVRRIKPEGQECVVEVLPERDVLGQSRREADPLGRYLAIASQTHDGVRGEMTLQDDRWPIGTLAELGLRGSGRGSQPPIRIEFIWLRHVLHLSG
jgi:hypothetical protein